MNSELCLLLGPLLQKLRPQCSAGECPGSLQQAVLEDALTAQALADLPEEGEHRAVLLMVK